MTRISQLVALTKAHRQLMVHIRLPKYAASPAIRRLDQQRAQRLHDDLVTRGFGDPQVAIGVETDDLPTAKSSQIAVLLSKGEGSGT